MSDSNILNGGAEVLREIRGSLLHLDTLKKTSTEQETLRQTYDKEMAAKQKAMDKEIETTVSKRVDELEQSFDSQIDKTRNRIKAEKSRRDKTKDEKVTQRIGAETADQHETIRSIKQEIKGTFTKDHIWRIFNTRYFFALFLPSSISDYLIILLTVIILAGLPLGIYWALGLENIWILLAMYACELVLFGASFFFIFKKVRNKHLTALREATSLREQIRDTKKSIKAKANSIRKDRDESVYGLESFDQSIGELETTLEGIVEQKKQALTSFENTTKQDIVNEIRVKYVDDIELLKKQSEESVRIQKETDDEISAITMDVSQNYEAYLGKENLKVSVIDSLIEIIDNGGALNISEALEAYKKQLEAAKSAK
ncbi:MAG: hypothetical protein K6E95_05020 [Lachnospiraceae bacterium]|nr:hypothetical protein [Lachnospiraceae bacterium]